MPEMPADEPGRTWWRDGVLYQIYPRSYMDTNGDGIGDLRGHHRAARPSAVARRRRHLARPDHGVARTTTGATTSPTTATSTPRSARSPTPRRSSSEAGEARHPRACSTSCRTTRATSTRGSSTRSSSRDSQAPRLVRVGRSRSPTARRRTTGSMAFDPARARVDVRRGERPVLPQPVPVVAARPQLVERRRPRRVRRHPALLVRPRRRRLPHRRVPLDHQGPRAARQPARHRRRPLVRADERPAAGVQRVAGPRCTTCCAAGARSPTATTRPASSSARPTCSSPSCSRRSTATATS